MSTTPGVDEWPNGAWTRVSITVEGAAPTEVSDAWWLMAGTVFADFRILYSDGPTTLPFSATQSFAGTFRYDATTSVVSWHHLVDTVDRPPVLDGCIRPDPREPRLLHETGDGFTELWARVDVEAAPARSFVAEGLVVVRVGPLAIALDSREGKTGAGRYRHGGGRWILLDEMGAPPMGPDELAVRVGP